MKLVIWQPLALAGLALFLTGCDAAPEYVVVNKTGQTLLTRPVFEECATGGSYRQDYLDEQTVPPMTQYRDSEVYGVRGGMSSLECVEIVTQNRRLILAQPYKRGMTYEVSEPVHETGATVPEIEDLPSQSGLARIKEDLNERPLGTAVFLTSMAIVIVPLLAAFIFAGFVTIRYFWRTYRPAPN